MNSDDRLPNIDNYNDHMHDHLVVDEAPLSAPQIIIKYLKSQTRPQSPDEIAENTGLNKNTVRARLSELKKSGHVISPYYGVYLINSAYGGGDTGSGDVVLRIQNLNVVSTVDFDKRIEKYEEFTWAWSGVGKDSIGDLKVRVELGSKKNRVSWRLSAREGVDIQTVRICRLCIEQMLHGMGFQMEDYSWEVHGVEVLRDLFGVSLDGLKSVSLDSLESTLMKIYAKPYGVRVERVIHRPMGFDEMLSILMGSIPEFHLVDSVSDCVSEVEKLTVAVKYLNGLVYSLKLEFLRLRKLLLTWILSDSGFSSVLDAEGDSS